jgi:hypothetical protein
MEKFIAVCAPDKSKYPCGWMTFAFSVKYELFAVWSSFHWFTDTSDPPGL